MHKEIWYEQLGFAFNPFTIKPGFFDDEVVGYDKEIEKVITALENDQMVFLEGDFGLGKTTILKYIINEFKGKNRVIYISRNRSDKYMNYSDLLKGASKGLKGFFGIKARNCILIVDETEKINKKDCEAIEHFYESGHIKSVLFVDKNLKDAGLSKSVIDEIGKNIIQLKSLSATEAVELAQSRLDDSADFISKDLIKAVYEHSNNNSRQFLENLEDVSRHAIAQGREAVTKEDLAVLTGKPIKVTPSKSTAKAAPKKDQPKKDHKRDANLIAFTEKHEVDTVLKHFDIERNDENRSALTKIGLTWKKDAAWKPHNRENFYKFVEETNALKSLKEPAKDHKRDMNLIAFTEKHEVDTVLKHFGIKPNEEAREQLKEIGLSWKRDSSWKPHNRENFYAYVEKTNALESLK